MKAKTHSDSQRLYDLLLGARTADKATLYFKDGRIMHGALIFNPFKGTGRLINIDQEISLDFAVDDLRDLNVTPHIAQNTSNRTSTIDAPTTRHAGYTISQQKRKRTEKPFGWAKTMGPREADAARDRTLAIQVHPEMARQQVPSARFSEAC
jgi:hypothetical protein